MASAARRLCGHLRTVRQLCADLARPPSAPPSVAWRGSLEDPNTGRVAVTGRLTRGGESGSLVILVHGLGGSAESPYMVRAAQAAVPLAIDTLRLNLRGADPAARDFYHGGLTAELHAAVADPAFAGYRRIAVLGYSMGGHVALRYAAEVAEPRLTAIAAVCSPLELRTVSEEFDQPSRWPYRFWVLRHLRHAFLELERAGVRLPCSHQELRRVRTFRQWDGLTVVPRFGFADVDDYYARASAAAVVDRPRVPCLLVASDADPVITPRAIDPYLPPHVEVRAMGEALGRLPRRRGRDGRPAPFTLLRHGGGGHVAFAASLGLDGALFDWLVGAPGRHAERSAGKPVG